MQSSDERQFWSHPAPDRREYEVHYHLPHPRRLVTMGEMVGASLFIGFVLFIATAISRGRLARARMTRTQTLRFSSENELLAHRQRRERFKAGTLHLPERDVLASVLELCRLDPRVPGRSG